MIRRVLSYRLRLVDAVALAAVAVLGLKLVSLMNAPAVPPAVAVAAGDESLPAFAKVLAQARTNYVPPDVAMTGATSAKEEPKETSLPSTKPGDDKPKRLPTERGPAAASPSERALLERLGERRDELQQKSRDFELRERLLEDAEKKLESRINELKDMEKAQESSAKSGGSESAALKNLVTMYETMKPKEAARVFDRLNHDVLVPVVLQMNPRKMAEVLAVMSPEAAEKLTVALAARAKLAGAPRASTQAPALPPNELPAIELPAAKPAR